MGDKMKKDKENKEEIDMTPPNERKPVFGDSPKVAERIAELNALSEPDYFDVVIERMAKDFCITEARKEYDKLAPQSKDNAQPEFLWVRSRAKKIWDKVYAKGFGA